MLLLLLVFSLLAPCYASTQEGSQIADNGDRLPDSQLLVQTINPAIEASNVPLPFVPTVQESLDEIPIGLRTALKTIDNRHRQVADTLRKEVRAKCPKGSCKGQKKEVLEKKKQLRQGLISFGQNAAEVDHQFAKTQQLKKAILEEMGVDDIIDPSDDGLYQGDIMLSAEQAEQMIHSIKERSEASRPQTYSGNVRQKRSGIFFPKYPFQKWNTAKTIKYMILPELKDTVNNITRAFEELRRTARCLSFQRVPYSWNHEKKQANMEPPGILIGSRTEDCWAITGRMNKTLNVINLGDGCHQVSTIVHELLHTLGVQHMQSREDRDNYIEINTANIQEGRLSEFEIADPDIYSVYGVKYDFESLMHYRALNSFAKDRLKPTIYAKKPYENLQAKMGLASFMRDSDATLLDRMYCGPKACVDKSPRCGVLALYGVTSRAWLIKNCQRSMGCVNK